MSARYPKSLMRGDVMKGVFELWENQPLRVLSNAGIFDVLLGCSCMPPVFIGFEDHVDATLVAFPLDLFKRSCLLSLTLNVFQ